MPRVAVRSTNSSGRFFHNLEDLARRPVYAHRSGGRESPRPDDPARVFEHRPAGAIGGRNPPPSEKLLQFQRPLGTALLKAVSGAPIAEHQPSPGFPRVNFHRPRRIIRLSRDPGGNYFETVLYAEL